MILEQKYSGDEWIFLEEVRDMPGFKASASADAIAMGLWMSRGCEVLGFEIKDYRNDWLRELKNPSKAETIFGMVDRFYLVSAKDVAQRARFQRRGAGWRSKAAAFSSVRRRPGGSARKRLTATSWP